ncbi:MAG: shikimate kinase [Candidatus Eremiobacteraeota bacterium]|nr:shikimate kinase [Candidatus Eremiobacteraeota bacterium]
MALVGFMGSGKSTVGRKLARRLGCAFVDTDALVVRDHGDVPTIFAREGEAAFRRYEQAAIRGALESTEPVVIALGGGALTVAANRQLLAARAYRIFIRVSPEQVLARLRKAKESRPLLGQTPTLARIRALYDRRISQYESADYVVPADRLSGRQVLDDIVDWLDRAGIRLCAS